MTREKNVKEEDDSLADFDDYGALRKLSELVKSTAALIEKN
eukprot:CAMPEP_0194049278 /NCGR_PEP_ID=MMETSP0009_2-20130614/30219_1 /TAXON_ID=210454 /ORGANISM="Grammatophora oceanica, Strain CCMP 410" /LENGTH=40 /DNA_ID= /DNA_START= /DNA_END= /DNA_ORIENTATION=